MASDPVNMPFKRDTAPAAAPGPTSALDGQLHLEAMLMEEFSYAGVTAYQAQEDRARMFNLYLLVVGVFGSGLTALFQVGPGAGIARQTGTIAAILLALGFLLSLAFFIKLIRLRQAWRESVLTMSVIKEFYIRQFQTSVPNVGLAFRWRLHTVPSGEKFLSVTHIVNLTIGLIGSFALGAAGFLATGAWLDPAFRAQNQLLAPVGAIVLGLAAFVAQMAYFRRSLNQHAEHELIAKLDAAFDAKLGPD